MATVILRDVIPSDLPIFFEHQRDPISNEIAAFPARDEEAFYAHWEKVMVNENNLIKAILFDDVVAGMILSFEMEGQREVGYWLGREFWGKGIASEALRLVLPSISVRPLYAHVAKHNIGSRRVLEKSGFKVTSEYQAEDDIEMFILRLE